MCRAPVEAAAVLATAGLAAEAIPEEEPTTYTGSGAEEDDDEPTSASSVAAHDFTEPRVSALRMFEDEDDGITVPVRVLDMTMDCFPSQKYVPDAGKVPGVKQCA